MTAGSALSPVLSPVAGDADRERNGVGDGEPAEDLPVPDRPEHL